mmetsp:Transcript_60745/g.135597  ORF Transcript_60745/g.135597 Transcript_60745/m.135597 type:complete len:208 (-) Transcript_60745:310-933(-)
MDVAPDDPRCGFHAGQKHVRGIFIVVTPDEGTELLQGLWLLLVDANELCPLQWAHGKGQLGKQSGVIMGEFPLQGADLRAHLGRSCMDLPPGCGDDGRLRWHLADLLRVLLLCKRPGAHVHGALAGAVLVLKRAVPELLVEGLRIASIRAPPLPAPLLLWRLGATPSGNGKVVSAEDRVGKVHGIPASWVDVLRVGPVVEKEEDHFH